MEETADWFSWRDPEAQGYVQELAEMIVGGIFRVKEILMNELEQVLQKNGMQPGDLPGGMTNDLAHVLRGNAHSRASLLNEARPNTHWQLTQVATISIDPAFESQRKTWQGELSTVLRYGLHLKNDGCWSLVAEEEDERGGGLMMLRRMEGERVVAQVTIRKKLKAFETRQYVTNGKEQIEA